MTRDLVRHRAFDHPDGQHPDEDLVLVGHGTAWTVLVFELAGGRPDLARWRSMTMPDLIAVPSPGPGSPGGMLQA